MVPALSPRFSILDSTDHQHIRIQTSGGRIPGANVRPCQNDICTISRYNASFTFVYFRSHQRETYHRILHLLQKVNIELLMLQAFNKRDSVRERCPLVPTPPDIATRDKPRNRPQKMLISGFKMGQAFQNISGTQWLKHMDVDGRFSLLHLPAAGRIHEQHEHHFQYTSEIRVHYHGKTPCSQQCEHPTTV